MSSSSVLGVSTHWSMRPVSPQRWPASILKTPNEFDAEVVKRYRLSTLALTHLAILRGTVPPKLAAKTTARGRLTSYPWRMPRPSRADEAKEKLRA